jgi:hypothetical protein
MSLGHFSSVRKLNSIPALNSVAARILGIAIAGTSTTTQPRFSGGWRFCGDFGYRRPVSGDS